MRTERRQSVGLPTGMAGAREQAARKLVYDGGSKNGMRRLTRVDYGPFDYYSNTIPKLLESFGYTPGGLLAGRTVAMNSWNASFAG